MDPTKQGLQECVALISSRTPGDSEAAKSGFNNLKRLVTHATKSDAETLLGDLEPKEPVLLLLAELYESHKLYRRQIEQLFKDLFRVDEWLRAFTQDTALQAKLHSDLSAFFDKEQLLRELPPAPARAAAADTGAATAAAAPAPEVAEPVIDVQAMLSQAREAEEMQTQVKHAAEAAMASEGRRKDPKGGLWYTHAEAMESFSSQYSEEEIQTYWQDAMEEAEAETYNCVEFLRKVSVQPYSVVGRQALRTGFTLTAGGEPSSLVAIMDACSWQCMTKGPGSAQGVSADIYRFLGISETFPEAVQAAIVQPIEAKLHLYDRGRACIHVVEPDLRMEAGSREGSLNLLATAYWNVLREFAASGLRSVRLMPMSSGCAAGFSVELPQMTLEALDKAFLHLSLKDQAEVLAAEAIDMCIATEVALPTFSQIWEDSGIFDVLQDDPPSSGDRLPLQQDGPIMSSFLSKATDPEWFDKARVDDFLCRSRSSESRAQKEAEEEAMRHAIEQAKLAAATGSSSSSFAVADNPVPRAAAAGVATLLAEARDKMQALSYRAKDRDRAGDAFDPLYRALAQARDGDDALEGLEPKDAILGFLVEMHKEHRMYKSKIASALKWLTAHDAWRQADKGQAHEIAATATSTGAATSFASGDASGTAGPEAAPAPKPPSGASRAEGADTRLAPPEPTVAGVGPVARPELPVSGVEHVAWFSLDPKTAGIVAYALPVAVELEAALQTLCREGKEQQVNIDSVVRGGVVHIGLGLARIRSHPRTGDGDPRARQATILEGSKHLAEFKFSQETPPARGSVHRHTRDVGRYSFRPGTRKLHVHVVKGQFGSWRLASDTAEGTENRSVEVQDGDILDTSPPPSDFLRFLQRGPSQGGSRVCVPLRFDSDPTPPAGTQHGGYPPRADSTPGAGVQHGPRARADAPPRVGGDKGSGKLGGGPGARSRTSASMASSQSTGSAIPHKVGKMLGGLFSRA